MSSSGQVRGRRDLDAVSIIPHEALMRAMNVDAIEVSPGWTAAMAPTNAVMIVAHTMSVYLW